MGRRLRKARYSIGQQAKVHDRSLAVLPLNARVVVDVVDDAYGIPEDPIYDARRGELVLHGPPKVTAVRSIRTDPLGALKAQGIIDDVAEFQSGHFPCSFIHFDMQVLWAVPPPVADSEHRCMHFFSHDCCATVGTDIVARQSKADAQTSFDIIASLEVAFAGQNIGAGQSAATTKSGGMDRILRRLSQHPAQRVGGLGSAL